jgi:hypothetical protein
MPIDDAHSLDVIPPHELPNQLRTCYAGILTLEEAQAKIGATYRVLELCPAQCVLDDKIVDATEVIFAPASTSCTN